MVKVVFLLLIVGSDEFHVNGAGELCLDSSKLQVANGGQIMPPKCNIFAVSC